MTVDRGLPPDLAAEILHRYADVLRVGRLILNGSEVCWSTSGSTESQLEALSTSFSKSLKDLPEVRDLEDSILSRVVYWFCKVVSINYALSDVLDVVKSKLGEGCSIMSSGHSGRRCVEYNVEVLPDRKMRAFISWQQKGNVVYCDPRTAKKKVKGTLSSLVTEFPLPPEHDFTPTYRLHLKEKRSRKQKMISKMSSLLVKQRPHHYDESLVLDSPLHSCKSMWGTMSTSTHAHTNCSSETPSELSEYSANSNMSLPSVQRADSDCSSCLGTVSDRLAAILMQVNDQVSIDEHSPQGMENEPCWKEMVL